MKKLLAIVLTLVLALMMAVPASAQYYYSFEDIFTQNGIFHFPQIYVLLDYYAYAIEDAEGIIECMEYGADGDQVCEWVNTLYFPLAGVTQEEYATMQERLHMIFDPVDAEFFCSVSYEYLGDYYKCTLKFTDLDNSYNLGRLAEHGFVEPGINYISMNLTEQGLLAQGYLKDY